MKFYHLIGFSIVLLSIEFTLLVLLKIELAMITRWIFVFFQGITLFFYGFAIVIYLIGSTRKKWVLKQQTLNK
ncbi:hypothetical protein [Enterococcus sp.]|uniref:hypothetical protein n=1 Tax=Enterococcus sp. TaxID=35783 RepID=UPI002FC68455